MSCAVRPHTLGVVFERIVIGCAGDQAGRDAVVLGARLDGLLAARGSVLVLPRHADVARSAAGERGRAQQHPLVE